MASSLCRSRSRSSSSRFCSFRLRRIFFLLFFDSLPVCQQSRGHPRAPVAQPLIAHASARGLHASWKTRPVGPRATVDINACHLAPARCLAPALPCAKLEFWGRGELMGLRLGESLPPLGDSLGPSWPWTQCPSTEAVANQATTKGMM